MDGDTHAHTPLGEKQNLTWLFIKINSKRGNLLIYLNEKQARRGSVSSPKLTLSVHSYVSQGEGWQGWLPFSLWFGKFFSQCQQEARVLGMCSRQSLRWACGLVYRQEDQPRRWGNITRTVAFGNQTESKH